MAVTDFTALTSNFKWPDARSGNLQGERVITYAINTTVQPHWDRVDSSAFLNTFESAERVSDIIRDAFWKWESAADIQVVQVESGAANINIGLFEFSASRENSGFAGFAYFPSNFGSTNTVSGDVFIDKQAADEYGLWLHEIGHALGLEHPFEGSVILDPALDNTRNTVMSYTGPFRTELGYLDRDAIEAMYGRVEQRNQIISRYEAETGPASQMMEQLRDFDGNLLGSFPAWKQLGRGDVQIDGDDELIFVNPELGRWAILGPDRNGMVDFNDHGAGGDTRVAAYYVDPLIGLGLVDAGSDIDSERRFSNDLRIDNLVLLNAGDYNRDGEQQLYFKTVDGTAYLNALLSADGDLRYANYQNEQQMRDYIADNGWDPSVYDAWLTV